MTVIRLLTELNSSPSRASTHLLRNATSESVSIENLTLNFSHFELKLRLSIDTITFSVIARFHKALMVYNIHTLIKCEEIEGNQS